MSPPLLLHLLTSQPSPETHAAIILILTPQALPFTFSKLLPIQRKHTSAIPVLERAIQIATKEIDDKLETYIHVQLTDRVAIQVLKRKEVLTKTWNRIVQCVDEDFWERNAETLRELPSVREYARRKVKQEPIQYQKLLVVAEKVKLESTEELIEHIIRNTTVEEDNQSQQHLTKSAFDVKELDMAAEQYSAQKTTIKHSPLIQFLDLQEAIPILMTLIPDTEGPEALAVLQTLLLQSEPCLSRDYTSLVIDLAVNILAEQAPSELDGGRKLRPMVLDARIKNTVAALRLLGNLAVFDTSHNYLIQTLFILLDHYGHTRVIISEQAAASLKKIAFYHAHANVADLIACNIDYIIEGIHQQTRKLRVTRRTPRVLRAVAIFHGKTMLGYLGDTIQLMLDYIDVAKDDEELVQEIWGVLESVIQYAFPPPEDVECSILSSMMLSSNDPDQDVDKEEDGKPIHETHTQLVKDMLPSMLNCLSMSKPSLRRGTLQVLYEALPYMNHKTFLPNLLGALPLFHERLNDSHQGVQLIAIRLLQRLAATLREFMSNWVKNVIGSWLLQCLESRWESNIAILQGSAYHFTNAFRVCSSVLDAMTSIIEYVEMNSDTLQKWNQCLMKWSDYSSLPLQSKAKSALSLLHKIYPRFSLPETEFMER